MAARSLLELEEHAFFILFLGFVLILFWVSVWGLTEETLNWIVEEYAITKSQAYIGLLLVVMGLIAVFPQILNKI